VRAHGVVLFVRATIGAAYGNRLLPNGAYRDAGFDCRAARFALRLRAMKVLVLGAGGVGAAFAAIAQRRPAFQRVVLADISPERVKAVVAGLGEPGRFAAERVDASSPDDVAALIGKVKPDAVLNACDPRFNEPIFDAAFEARVTYLDMAMTLSRPNAEKPYERPGVKLGDYQLERHGAWEDAGLLALVGIGVEPGLSDVFAAHAARSMFSTIAEVGVRDGADLVVEGYDFAPTFSIWTTIEECLNPPLIWERERGHYTTAPFSEPEVFDFPEGIGKLECVNVEHEEVVLVPRWVTCERVTFKYGLGSEFIDVLRTLHKLGLDSTEPLRVRDVRVAPRDVVAAALPDPATLGERMTGRTCAGTWVRGTGTDGKPRSTYLYHIVDNEYTMREYGSQAVVWQTAVNPVVALELLDEGVWRGTGVLGPEAFEPEPFLERLEEIGAPHGVVELAPV
jgi:saccharopine dehydrogenase (NAD+, L-lysine forming)